MTSSHPFGINLIGFASANLGLGAALRNTASVLDGIGMPYCVIDIALPDGRSGQDSSLAHRRRPPGPDTPYPVNLFHLNPPELAGLLDNPASGIPMRGKMNVCVPFWELSRAPQSWLRVLSRMDMVLAPSRFIEGALASLEGVPVRSYPQFVPEPGPASPDRERWGIRSGQTAFLVSFELSSDMYRKNPAGAMLAFTRAFRGSSEAVLILKLNNAHLNAATRTAAGTLRSIASRMGNALVLEDALARGDLMSLYSSADVFVSLHRGEGLGLSLLESMCLGKPVLATGWSGNMDFCDDAGCALVDHRLVPVHPESAYFGLCEGQDIRWAEPDVDAAAEWMRRLARDPQLREKMGHKAREAAGKALERARRGDAFASLRAYYEGRFVSARGEALPPASVLIQNRCDQEALPGGDTVVVQRLQGALAAGGLRTGICLQPEPDLRDWDMVQLVNITRSLDTLRQLRNARLQGKPAALIPLYEDLDRYLDLAVRVNLVYHLCAGEGRPTSPEQLLETARNVGLRRHPLEEDTARRLGIGNREAQQEILDGVDWIFTSGKSETDCLKARFRIRAPVTEIPFGIDPAFRNADGALFRSKYGLKDFVLSVGRLEARKNYAMLIEIFRERPDLQLVLIGYFQDANVEQSVRRYLPPNVMVLNRLPREEVISAFAAARVHALVSWFELPGLVSLEAAAAGARVVTTSWGTAPDCLGDRVQYCRPDDPASIRRAILEAFDSAPDPVLRDFVLETYDWRKTAERMREAYSGLRGSSAWLR